MVRRHPTPRELGMFSEHREYSFLLLASSPDCSVCESELTLQDTVVCLPCKHLFHPECIIPWIKDVSIWEGCSLHQTNGLIILFTTSIIPVLLAERHYRK